MKKIVIFSLAYYPHVGGAEIAIKEITDRISDIEFDLITLRFKGEPVEERLGNVHVHRVGQGESYLSKILFIPRAALLARRLHTADAFDAAWCMMSYMTFPVVLLCLLGVRIPYVLTLQDGDPFEHVFRRWYIWLFLPLLSYGFRHAAVISALSTYLATWAEHLGYEGEVALVPNGADVAHFAHATPADIGKAAGELWLVTTSRLVHKNAIDDVIRALVLLPIQVKFLILGTGPEQDALLDLADDLSVRERVMFQGYVPHTELPSYLHACDIFIRPSRTEGFGSSFVEAMAAGLPVIATQEGGIRDFLFDAKRNPHVPATGWAVSKDSPEEIAQAVRAIWSRPEEVAQVTDNAKRIVLEKYTWETVAAQMHTLFRKAARPRTIGP